MSDQKKRNNGVKRGGIDWNSHIMSKYGQSIRAKIIEVHEPYMRVMAARRLARALKEQQLLAVSPESKAIH